MKRILLLTMLLIAASCARQQAPLVGVSCSRYHSTNLLPETYTNAIAAAGGVPVILATVDNPDAARSVMEKLDGLLLSGGEDVNPAWYGEEVLNSTVEFDSVRDRSDSLLLAAALQAGKPVLAICRGSQLANVFLGGTLYQDIPTQLPGSLEHSGDRLHTIGLEPGSFLARAYGADSLEVNSFHHQCVKDLGKGITVTARSEDGIVEAWEAPGITAVQFHPEKMLPDNPFWLAFFQAYIDLLPR